MNLVELKLGLVRHQFADRLEDRIHRTVAGRLRRDVLAFDIERKNVYVPESGITFNLAGKIASKGFEVAAAANPFGGLRLWGNAALVQSRFVDFSYIDGKHVTTQSIGNGPVDAIFKAIRELVPHEAKLELYQVHAVTEGTDAQAEVSVRLSEQGRSYTAKGADPDTLVASAKAYLGALNKLTSKRNRTPGIESRIHSTDVG